MSQAVSYAGRTASWNNRNIEGRNKFLRAGVRPATPLICEFLDAHREEFGVVPICRALAVHGVQIAPRTYWAHRSSGPSKRTLWDTTITEILAGYYETRRRRETPAREPVRQPEDVGAPAAPGHPGGAAHLERIMRRNGWRGVTHARRAPRTTERDPAAARGTRPGGPALVSPSASSRTGRSAGIVDSQPGSVTDAATSRYRSR